MNNPSGQADVPREALVTRLVGRKAQAGYYDPSTWEVFVEVGQLIDQGTSDRLEVLDLADIERELQGALPEEARATEWRGWGRFKSAVARALLRPGSGEIRVNGQPIWVYFEGTPSKGRGFLRRLLEQGETRSALSQLDAVVLVHGSTVKAVQQSKAVAHALAHALASYAAGTGERMKRQGFGGVRVKNKKKEQIS